MYWTFNSTSTIFSSFVSIFVGRTNVLIFEIFSEAKTSSKKGKWNCNPGPKTLLYLPSVKTTSRFASFTILTPKNIYKANKPRIKYEKNLKLNLNGAPLPPLPPENIFLN